MGDRGKHSLQAVWPLRLPWTACCSASGVYFERRLSVGCMLELNGSGEGSMSVHSGSVGRARKDD